MIIEQIAAQLRLKLQQWIDLACYRMLRNIETNMTRENTKTTRYIRTTNKAICCVWAPITLPIGMKRQVERDRPSIFPVVGYIFSLILFPVLLSYY